MRLAPLLALMSLSSPAMATNGLEWQWEVGEKRTYELAAHVLMPTVLTLESERNHQARLAEWFVEVVSTCEALEENKRGWRLRCDVHDLRLRGQGPVQDQDKLQAIIPEFDERMSRGWIQVSLSRNGRISDFDLEGLEKETPRLKRGHELARVFLYRAFTALDMQLPRKGDDRNQGAWSDDRPRAMEMVPAPNGTSGGSETAHVVKKVDGPEVHVATAARGTITGDEDRIGYFAVELNGAATFDRERGILLDRGYNLVGTATASSVYATTDGKYLHGAVAEFLPNGTEGREPYGPSGLLTGADAWSDGFR